MTLNLNQILNDADFQREATVNVKFSSVPCQDTKIGRTIFQESVEAAWRTRAMLDLYKVIKSPEWLGAENTVRAMVAWLC